MSATFEGDTLPEHHEMGGPTSLLKIHISVLSTLLFIHPCQYTPTQKEVLTGDSLTTISRFLTENHYSRNKLIEIT